MCWCLTFPQKPYDEDADEEDEEDEEQDLRKKKVPAFLPSFCDIA
jgi:hypothetical protein